MSDTPRERQEEREDQQVLTLEAQLGAVTARVFQLEREVAALRGFSNVAPPVAAEIVAEPKVAATLVEKSVREEHSLESRVGSQWFNRIGIVAVLIGVAWFLKFAFDSHWVGALGRVLIGLGCGAALVAWSERFRAKGFAGFSYSLKGLGSGVLYLSLWSAVSMYHLISPGWGFAGMIAVTALNALVAWMQDAELLAVYALAGGFATPLLLSTGQNDEIFLFSYLVLMNAAMLTLLALKGWSRLLVLSFLGTAALFWGWYWNYYAASELGATALFLLLFFLLFAAATVLGRPRAQDDVARLLLSMGNALFGFLGFYAMLAGHGRSSDVELAWCAVGFGVFYLGLRRWMKSAATGGSVLADVHVAIAITFFTLAIPLAVHGHWVTVGWMVEGAALVWLATRMRSQLIPMLAAGALLLGLGSLAIDATVGQTQVVWNTRFLSFAVATAVMAFCARLARRAATPGDDTNWWNRFAPVGEVTAGLLVVIAGGLEIHTWWWMQPLAAAAESRDYLSAVKERGMAAQFTYSAWFLLASVVALVAGFRRRSALLRWEGLVLLAVTIVKVFVMDTSQLSQGYRIVSFLTLGVLLLGVSFAYQKDWLQLRSAD